MDSKGVLIQSGYLEIENELPGIIGLSKSAFNLVLSWATSIGDPLSLIIYGEEPAFINISTRRTCPFLAAIWSGVSP